MILKISEIKTLLRATGAKFFLIVVVAIFCLPLTSCDKASSVGLDVQPKNDLLNVGFQDTVSLLTRTVKEDSIRSDQGLITNGIVLLGKYNDPIFGEAKASIYSQVLLNSAIYPTTLGTNPTCDSIVLSLAYNGVYYGENSGRTPPKKQTINVYQVLQDISTVSSYYSDTTLTRETHNDLANGYSFVPDIDSVYAEGTAAHPLHRVAPQLRIPLQVNFGQTLLNNRLTGIMTSNSTFESFLKGLYITAENTTGLNKGEGRIISYYSNSTVSAVRLYYKYTGLNWNGQVDSVRHTSFDLSLTLGARFAHLETTAPAGSNLNTQLTSSTSTSNFATTYVQSLAGVKTKISTPYLMSLNDNGPIAINKAELVVKVDPATLNDNGNTYAPPSTLLVFGINDDKTSYVLPDFLSSPFYYDGNFNATTNEYRLNITRYIQQVLDKKLHNNGVYLLVPHITSVTSGTRVVIGGADNSSGNNLYQMKLNISYTKLH